jgi:hypothetical protein
MNEFERRERVREGVLDAERTAANTDARVDGPELSEKGARDRRVLLTPSPTPTATPSAESVEGGEGIPVERQPKMSGAAVGTAKANEDQKAPLFVPTEANDLRARWDSVQVSFVDQPRKAVEDADELVSVMMKRLQEIFSEERQKMERQWSEGADASTEDYRLALRRYRSFFTRLLSI